MGVNTNNTTGAANRAETRSRVSSPAKSPETESGGDSSANRSNDDVVTLSSGEEQTEARQMSDMLDLRSMARDLAKDRAARAEAWMAGPSREPSTPPDPEQVEAAELEFRRSQNEYQNRVLDRFNTILSESGGSGGTYQSPPPTPADNLTSEQRDRLRAMSQAGASPSVVYGQRDFMMVNNLIRP